MKSLFVAIAALTATIVSAQNNIVSVTSPLANTVYTAGQDAIISWINPTVDVIPQIVLAKGDPFNLQVVSVIAENVDAKKGSYTWKIPANTEPGNDYALELGSSPDISFSGLFSIKAAVVQSSSSTTSASTTTTTVTRTTTTTASPTTSASVFASAISTAVSSAANPASSSAISSVASVATSAASSVASVATSATSSVASVATSSSIASVATTASASTTPTPEAENAGTKMSSNNVILAIAGIAAAALI